MRAGIYCRISKDTEQTRAGVQRQEADCRAFCEARGWTVVQVYIDNSRSAYDRRKVRPGYQQMLAALRAGELDAVVVWHLDRLYRHTLELEDIIELVEQRSITVATVTGGDYDLTTTDGRAMARVVTAFARKEVEDKSRRHKRLHQQLAEEGRWQGGGTRPYGYSCSGTTPCDVAHCPHDKGQTIIEAEADNIRAAAAAVLAGGTLRAICADWNHSGVTTVTGRPWRTGVLRRILIAPHTAGLRSHKGAITARGQWPAILTERDWKKLTVLLTDPARRTNETGGERRYFLSGLLACGRCHTRMVARPRADKRRAYVCARDTGGCGQMGVLAEPLEDVVAGLLFAHIDESSAVAQRAARHQGVATEQQLLDDIADAEAQLAQAARDHYDAKLIGRGQFLAASQALEARASAARRQLVRLHADSLADEWAGDAGRLETDWQSMSLDRRRAVLGAFVDTITIGPAIRGLNRFDRDRLAPTRGGGIDWRI